MGAHLWRGSRWLERGRRGRGRTRPLRDTETGVEGDTGGGEQNLVLEHGISTAQRGGICGRRRGKILAACWRQNVLLRLGF